MSRQKILMCQPDYFGIDYIINPWMEGKIGKADPALAKRQWNGLRDALAAEADLAFALPQPKLPDMVFTANAGMVLGNKVIVSRFHSRERQGEEPFFRKWFEENNFEIMPWPLDVSFEGAGDALLDRGKDIIWAAHGFRSDEASALLLEKIFKRRTIHLRLVNPHFYHLDTCLCPLEGGYLMYYPAAFDEASQKRITDLVRLDYRIVVGDADAVNFACNAVDLNRKVFMNNASQELQAQLKHNGFQPVITPLTEYLKSGGAAKCLTLKLNEV